MGLSQAVLSSHELVEFQSHAIKGRLPPAVVRDDKGQVANQMWRILQKQAALLQRLHYEWDVSLLKVPNAAMCEFSAPAGCSLAEIALFQQKDVISTRRGIDRNADTCGPAAHNNHVPRLFAHTGAVPHLGAVHVQYLYLEVGSTDANQPADIRDLIVSKLQLRAIRNRSFFWLPHFF